MYSRRVSVPSRASPRVRLYFGCELILIARACIVSQFYDDGDPDITSLDVFGWCPWGHCSVAIQRSYEIAECVRTWIARCVCEGSTESLDGDEIQR